MKSGLVKYDWNHIESYTDDEISYFLSLEGKSIEAIAKIRNIDRAAVQKHIINAKIKYRYLVKSDSISDLFKSLASAVKDERIMVLNSLDRVNRAKLIHFLNDAYFMELTIKEKEAAVWIMGELRSKESVGLLIKATVNNHVNIRRMAISALGKIEDEKAVPALIRAVDDSNPQVVSYAVKALAKMPCPSADEKIRRLMEKTDKEYIKASCETYFEMAHPKEEGNI